MKNTKKKIMGSTKKFENFPEKLILGQIKNHDIIRKSPGWESLKGTVSIILNEPPRKDGNVRFTTVVLNLNLIKNVEDIFVFPAWSVY